MTMTDLKTTLAAFVTATAGLLSHFGVIIPDSWTTPIIFVGVLVLGFFAKDKPKA